MGQEYYRPETIEEALTLLSENGDDAGIIAGGTDLIVRKKKGIKLPDKVISISEIKGLDAIQYDENSGLKVGSTATMADIASNETVFEKYTALAESAGVLAEQVIRRQATVGGNLCNAAPSAETSTPLLALGASVCLTSRSGDRVIPLEELFLGPGKTSKAKDEILTAIKLPPPSPHGGSIYLKHTRRHGADLAVVGVAVNVEMDGNIVKDIKIALGSVAPTVIRAKDAEQILLGKTADPELIKAAGDAAADDSKPISDVRSSADYRKEIVAVLTRRGIEEAIKRANGEVL